MQSTFTLGIVGYPLEHSLSPQIHSVALRIAELKGSYARFPVQVHQREQLSGIIESIRAGELHGLNVTLPHKRAVVPLLDELTPTAEAIGSVNTIFADGNRVLGDNTDAEGFKRDLARLAPSLFEKPAPRALVLGAGGAARAVTYALLDSGWQVNVAARRLEQAQELSASPLTSKAQISDWGLGGVDLVGLDLVVNATSLGMAPDVEGTPWPRGRALPESALIYDLVYEPRPTRLVRGARAQGLTAFNGLGMLLEQAALSFARWTGKSVGPERLANEMELSSKR